MKFGENLSSGSPAVYVLTNRRNGLTDRTKLTDAFQNFANAPKKKNLD